MERKEYEKNCAEGRRIMDAKGYHVVCTGIIVECV
jgi:hypothetical protein